MANRQQQAVSKPLLIVLVVVALIGLAYFVYTRSGGSAADETVEGLPTMPEGFNPKPPANEPGAVGGGGG